MVFWLKHQTASCSCIIINLQDFCHLRISLDSSIKSEKWGFVLLAKARTAGKEDKIFITLFWKNKLKKWLCGIKMWRIFSGYLKTITFPILIPIFFSRYWDNIASGEDDDSTEVIHPGVFCLLDWLVGFAFLFQPRSTNEHKGLFPSSHTCKSIMKVHGEKKKIDANCTNYNGLQLLSRVVAGRVEASLNCGLVQMTTESNQSLWIQSLLRMHARHHNLMWVTKSK